MPVYNFTKEHCSSSIMLTVDSLFTISWLRNCSDCLVKKGLLINTLNNFSFLYVMQTNKGSTTVVNYKNNQLAYCLAWNNFLFKLAYFCNICAKLNKLIISMQGPDKNMLHVSEKIAVFIKKVSLWKEDITNVSGRSQCFTFIWTKVQIKQNIKVVFIVFSSITCRKLS